MILIVNDDRPLAGCRKPAIRLSSVLFPAPLGPSTAIISPAHGEREAHRQMLVKPGYISQF
jgi:hypothetical protein